MTGPTGVDIERLGAWAGEGVAGWRPPLEATLIAGGKSNLTYRVTDAAGHTAALRRPPLHGVLPTAHDVLREHRILAALGPADVPVPQVIAACDDDAVIGAPFYLMEFVEGRVLAEPSDADGLDVAARHRAGLSLVEALAALQAVDVDAVGLGTLARRDAYVERQLGRWSQQFEKVKQRDIPAVARVHDRLVAAIPPQPSSTVVHGDFRLGNCVVGDDGEVRAILDWELCTLGDPLADLAFVLVSWPDDDRTALALPGSNRAPGFATRDELVARYREVSGRDVGDLDFYVALSYWRLACIIEGVYSRSISGAQGDKEVDLDLLRARPPVLAELAEEAAARIRS